MPNRVYLTDKCYTFSAWVYEIYVQYRLLIGLIGSRPAHNFYNKINNIIQNHRLPLYLASFLILSSLATNADVIPPLHANKRINCLAEVYIPCQYLYKTRRTCINVVLIFPCTLIINSSCHRINIEIYWCEETHARDNRNLNQRTIWVTTFTRRAHTKRIISNASKQRLTTFVNHEYEYRQEHSS